MARRAKVGRGARWRPGVEGLESRQLLAVTTLAYAVPPVNGVFFDTTSSITDGPDGNLWFTATGSRGAVGNLRTTSAIGEIVPSTGEITLYPRRTPSPHLSSIISGPGGDLWYLSNNTDTNVLSVGQIDPATGTDIEYPIGSASKLVNQPAIAEGPDGNLWFTDPANASVDVFRFPSTATTRFPLPTNSGPGGIVSGPGGLLWFTEAQAFTQPTTPGFHGAITSIDPTTHAIVEHPTTYAPLQLTDGPDDHLWFDEVNNGGPGPSPTYFIGDFNPTGPALVETPVVGSVTGGLTTGPDGLVWFTGGSGGEIDPATHRVAQFFGSAAASGIVTGPDHKIWYTDGNQIEKATIVLQDQAVIEGSLVLNYAGLGSTMLGAQGGLTVYLDTNGDSRFEPGEPSTLATPSGAFQFTGLKPGTYTVRVAYPANITTFPGVVGPTFEAPGGVTAGDTIGVAPGSAIQPLTFKINPFLAGNPDVSTAEVNGLYQILFDREPDLTGLANAVAYLKNGESLQALAAILMNTVEYDTRVVSLDYLNFAGRAGSPEEIGVWVNLMQHGTSVEQDANLMLNSPGFNAAHATDASYVQALYTDVLGRQATDADVAGWSAAIASGRSRATVARDFVFGPAAMNAAVLGFAAVFDAGPPDQATLQYTVSFLTTGQLTLADVASAFAASAGFVRRANASVG